MAPETKFEVNPYEVFGNNPIFNVDISQFNFMSSMLTVEDFTSRNRNSLSVNFFNAGDIHLFNSDIIWRPASDETLSGVYDTIRLALVDGGKHGKVRVVTREYGSFDTYDFSSVSSIFADNLRKNGNPTPFRFFGTGHGTIKLRTPRVKRNYYGPKF